MAAAGLPSRPKRSSPSLPPRARLDTDSWRRQRYFLTHPATWAERRHLDHADLPATPVQEQLSRLRLIELFTGTHPPLPPQPLRLPERRSQDYAGFVFILPGPMARCLHQQARALLAHAVVHEPVTWERPFDWASGITWPGPDRRLALTAYGQRFARDVRPALESLAQSANSKHGNHGAVGARTPGGGRHDARRPLPHGDRSP